MHRDEDCHTGFFFLDGLVRRDDHCLTGVYFSLSLSLSLFVCACTCVCVCVCVCVVCVIYRRAGPIPSLAPGHGWPRSSVVS